MAARGNSTGWSPYVKVYDPLKAGSIDGTDLIPHDNAVVRAICAEYKPPSASTVQSKPSNTIFVGRLNLRTTDDQLHEEFSKFGSVKSCRVVRDVITGISRGYGFVEFKREADAQTAWHVGHGSTFHERQILVEWEFSRTMPGWIPRRLGGGLGGKKESGQLRFGGRDRPFKRPFILPPEQDTVDRKSSLKVFDTPKQSKTNNDSERTNFGWSPQDKRFHHKSNFDDDQSRHRKKTGSSSHEKNRKWQSRDRGNNQSRYEDDRHKYRKENDERSRHTYDQDSRKYNRQSTSHFTNYSDNHQKNYTEEKMSHYSHLVGFRRKSGKYDEDIESSYFEETVKTDDVKEGQRSDNKNSHRRSCNNKDYCRQETSKFTSENEEKQKRNKTQLREKDGLNLDNLLGFSVKSTMFNDADKDQNEIVRGSFKRKHKRGDSTESFTSDEHSVTKKRKKSKHKKSRECSESSVSDSSVKSKHSRSHKKKKKKKKKKKSKHLSTPNDSD